MLVQINLQWPCSGEVAISLAKSRFFRACTHSAILWYCPHWRKQSILEHCFLGEWMPLIWCRWLMSSHALSQFILPKHFSLNTRHSHHHELALWPFAIAMLHLVPWQLVMWVQEARETLTFTICVQWVGESQRILQGGLDMVLNPLFIWHPQGNWKKQLLLHFIWLLFQHNWNICCCCLTALCILLQRLKNMTHTLFPQEFSAS